MTYEELLNKPEIIEILDILRNVNTCINILVLLFILAIIILVIVFMSRFLSNIF